ncbi:MAG: YbjQ family protein [Myxococcota bacterium]|nr:YbjQ family protein [Myxococcota bacterium]
MPMSTSEQLAGYRIIKVLGLVRGNSVRARHLGRDILATFRNIVGGEINDYTKLLAESREQSIDRMMDQARQMGANAVIGVRFTTAAVMQGAAEMLAYGTAVLVQVEDGPEQ